MCRHTHVAAHAIEITADARLSCVIGIGEELLGGKNDRRLEHALDAKAVGKPAHASLGPGFFHGVERAFRGEPAEHGDPPAGRGRAVVGILGWRQVAARRVTVISAAEGAFAIPRLLPERQPLTRSAPAPAAPAFMPEAPPRGLPMSFT